MNTQPAHTDIIQGKVITKAVLQLAGKVHIIAVFNTSTFYQFFFHFEAPTARTPRRKWTYTQQYHMLHGDAVTTRGRTASYTMKSFVTQQALLKHSTKTTIRNYLSAKAVRALFYGVANPAKTAEPEPSAFEHVARHYGRNRGA